MTPENYAVDSNTMFAQIMENPGEYPIMLLRQGTTLRHAMTLANQFHVFPIMYNGIQEKGIVDNYFKGLPDKERRNREGLTFEEYKESIGVTELRSPFEEGICDVLVQGEPAKAKVFNRYTPDEAIDSTAKTFWVEDMEYNNESRKGILITHLQNVIPDDVPEGESHVQIIGAWFDPQ